MIIGEQIMKYRTAKGLTQAELAELLDVSRQTVTKWEADDSLPTIPKLIKLASIFNISVDLLLNGEKTQYDKIRDLIYRLAAEEPRREDDCLPFISRYMKYMESIGQTPESIVNGILFIGKDESLSQR